MGSTRVIYELIGKDAASPAFDRAGRSASTLERTMNKAAKTMAVAGAVMAGAAVAIGVESVKSATDFQASMTKISTQAGASQKSVESLTKSVLALAPSTQQGPQALSEALYHLKSVGMDNVDAMKALKTASDLAAVGGANLEDTTNALAGAWRSGIKGAQTFGQTAATVNAIIGAGNMKMEDFVAAIGTGILPAAKTFGVSLQSVGAALALMTDEGVPAEDAATRLRMSLSLLGAPSQAADKVLKQIGLSGLQLANAMRGPGGLVGAISLLKSHLDASGLSASRQAQILSQAFGGGRSSSAILTMVNNLSVLEGKQKQINDTTGRYGAAVAAQRKTAQAQFALLRSAAETLSIKLGLALLPPVTAFVQYLVKTGVPDVVAFTKKVAGMIPVGKIKGDIGQVKGLLGGAWKSLTDFIGGKVPDQGKPTPVPVVPIWTGTAKALANMPKPPPVNVPVWLGKPASASPVPIWTGTAPMAAATKAFKPDTIVDKLMAAFKKINWGNLFVSLFKGAVNSAQKIGSAFMDLLGKINWTAMGGAFAKVAVGLAVGLINGLIPALIDEAIHHPMDMLMFVLSLIPVGRVAGILIKVLKDVPLIGPLVKFLLGPIEKAGGIVESWLGKILKKIFGPIWRKWLGPFFQDIAGWLVSRGVIILRGLQYGLEDGWRFVAGWLGKIGKFLLSPFAKAGKWLLGIGKDILGGLWWGAKLEFGLTMDWIRLIGRYILAPFAKAGKWLLSKGRDILGGLWNGLKAVWNMVNGWLASIRGWILGKFAKAGSWLLSQGRNIIGGLWNGLKAAWSFLWSWSGKIHGWIASRFASAGSWLVSHGRNIIGGLYNGIRSVIKGVGGWIKRNVVDPVINWVKHWFGIKSPSTVMASLGSHLMSGLFKGMMSHDLTGMVGKIFGSLPSALGAIVKKGLVSVANLPAKAISALGGLAGKGLSWLGSLLGFSGGGGNSANEALGKRMAAAVGWTGGQWTALQALWTRESGWRTNATNPTSGAYGIPQSLPASKMASAGSDWLTNPATQIRWGLGYIASRYGSPAAAWAHEGTYGWYGHGGLFRAGQLIGVGDRGRELIAFSQGGRVFSPEESAKITAGAKSDGSAAPLVGELHINHVPGYSTPKDVENAIGAAARQARVARSG